jgi:LAS superfamily LD-carboxypeptidase LdcB
VKWNREILTGKTSEHIEWLEPNKIGVHKEVAEPFKALQKSAAQAGFELTICSGFRSFEAQLNIWNAKATGQRPILDSQSQRIVLESLTPREIVYSILRWSALPGLSRHHWGTDLDVFDKKTLPTNYQLQLIPSEFEGAGYFAPLHQWLDQHLSEFGFFRPYAQDLGGVSPERWHISFKPLAQTYLQKLTLELIQEALKGVTLELKATVERELPQIYEQFFKRISPA